MTIFSTAEAFSQKLIRAVYASLGKIDFTFWKKPPGTIMSPVFLTLSIN
jgi:hypothetical protein